MKKVALILAGCGFQDGTEITEAVCSLLALSQAGVQVQSFSLSETFPSSDHWETERTEERHLLSESARIVRGQVSALEELDPHLFDALLFPGGFGAALHLCSWAKDGAQCQVHPLVKKVILQFYEESKPIGALCIAPVLLGKVLGDNEVTLTLGANGETAIELEKTGAIHEPCSVDDFVTDRANKVISSPAYMYDDATPAQVYKGIQGLVSELVEMA